ncbi:MAG TPA: D-aminoacyl-tRNA deacylase [Deltaproteobacteria bacterium]|nr:D-aminoacyl-tRNA deacylase [Deltaproteobacteria bacterium]HOM28012.1 D-aminoacyl-tRNA deacylase [Deltaproteobacteria bacterium]
MRTVVQRVSRASVKTSGVQVCSIDKGLCCLVGVEKGDGEGDLDYTARKIVGLRIFEDEEGAMNLDVQTTGGDILLVSQFTLLADARKGRRPSFADAEDGAQARELFDALVAKVRGIFPGRVETGVFGAMMEVDIVNNGPVTILLDSRRRF